MSNIPANLYFGPEVPDSALPGAVFNDGVCLYRGGEHGWLYMCHVTAIQKIKNSPLADYAIAIPDGELASLNEPMAVYRDGNWLSLSNQHDRVNVVGLVFPDHPYPGMTVTDIPNNSVFISATSSPGFARASGEPTNLKLMYRHEGEDYVMASQEYVPSNVTLDVARHWLKEEEPVMSYLDLNISARFAVNIDRPPSPGDTWVDNEFNEFVFDAERMWTYIGKMAFNHRGSMFSGIDVLRTLGPHVTGDAYLVDNFVYVYNAIVKRFVVIQCAPGSDDVPFEFYPPEALEPIPIQGIYRRDVDSLPSEPNGCGYIVVEPNGKHSLYNQYGLHVDMELPEPVTYPNGKRAPLVTMGNRSYRDECYRWDGLDPEDGDVWLHNKQLHTYYQNEWRVLPAGIPYTQRHLGLAGKVQEIKERIRLGQEMGRPLESQQMRDRLFEQHQRDNQHNVDHLTEKRQREDEEILFERNHPFLAWLRRLCSSKPR